MLCKGGTTSHAQGYAVQSNGSCSLLAIYWESFMRTFNSLVLFTYVGWFYLDCAMDETCHLVCHHGGRGGCYTQRSAPAETGH